jgi:hypothetical protein
MTPERMAGVVARWVSLYTRNLPPAIAERRSDEIDADLHDHIAHERACGTDDRQIALSIADRMVRGLAADASWRRRMIRHRSTRKEVMKKSAIRVGLATAFIVLLPLVAMQFTDEVDFGVFDFVAAAVLVAGTGVLLEVAVRKPRAVVYRACAAAIGVAAIVLGQLDDAPGLILFGLLLIAGAIALSLKTALRSE